MDVPMLKRSLFSRVFDVFIFDEELLMDISEKCSKSNGKWL